MLRNKTEKIGKTQKATPPTPKPEVNLQIKNGHVVIFGDAHFDPREKMTTAYRALLEYIEIMKPRHIIANGDSADFSSISRFGRINDDTVVKHRFKGGVNAVLQNVIHSGKHFFSGHLHRAEVRAYSDYTGTKWGCDHGCLANPDGRFFLSYTENGVKNWRSSFCVATFRDGKLLMPELVLVDN
jgi:hypothetical protein